MTLHGNLKFFLIVRVKCGLKQGQWEDDGGSVKPCVWRTGRCEVPVVRLLESPERPVLPRAPRRAASPVPPAQGIRFLAAAGGRTGKAGDCGDT